jgi:hypothetical protein
MSKIAVDTGAARFIGSNLVDQLLCDFNVMGTDNLRTSKLVILKESLKNSNFQFINSDIRDTTRNWDSLKNVETVFHVAANTDVRGDVHNTSADLEYNICALQNMLEKMKQFSVTKIILSSLPKFSKSFSTLVKTYRIINVSTKLIFIFFIIWEKRLILRYWPQLIFSITSLITFLLGLSVFEIHFGFSLPLDLYSLPIYPVIASLVSVSLLSIAKFWHC